MAWLYVFGAIWMTGYAVMLTTIDLKPPVWEAVKGAALMFFLWPVIAVARVLKGDL